MIRIGVGGGAAPDRAAPPGGPLPSGVLQEHDRVRVRCGSTFEPSNGNWSFVDAQDPGITFAITGPWRSGSLQ